MEGGLVLDFNFWFCVDPTSPSGLRWKQRPGKSVVIGSVAGSLYGVGYYRILLKGKRYLAHRVLWEMYNGAVPVGTLVDHIDADITNNTIANLRLASPSENSYNRKAIAGKVLPKGIIERRDKPGYYQASIRCAGSRLYQSGTNVDVLVTWLHSMRDNLHGQYARS